MKKINLIILLVALIGSAGYVGYLSSMDNPAEDTLLSAPVLLPDFTLSDINGESKSIYQLAENKPTLLIYFNSTCHLCQEELATLSKRIDEFKEYNLILTTVEPLEEMIGFVVGLGVKDKSYVHFLLDSRMDVAGYLQIKSVPSIYCYDAKKQLIAEYVGITKIDLLLEKLAKGK
ncbi:redoxin domain-containing protein [Algoriphagus sp. AGSA1]|uniref:TlpA family protein disulfide reductase n=1 Tax=Algoriphagus sp. AGSA1 TaxID=2907213 RepID=UPI001F3DB960|nr:redoxin domain-containing protein [Algoriphagus sp. AGSA1]MCE7054075.1 redoxin domain-containing protein [Algoriphagus sp. AGSA1]